MVKNFAKDSYISKWANLGQPIRFKTSDNEYPKAIKLPFRPLEDEICAICSTWTDSDYGEPMSIELEARLYLNGVFYSHGQEGFGKIILLKAKSFYLRTILKRFSLWFDRGDSTALQLICFDCLAEENAVYQSQGSINHSLSKQMINTAE